MNDIKKPPNTPRSYIARDQDNRAALFWATSAHTDFPLLHQDISSFLQAPRSLAGLWQIVRSLRELLPIAGNIDSALVPTLNKIQEWLRIINFIPADSPFRGVQILSSINEGTDKRGKIFKRPPFEGIIDNSPVWAALWFTSGTQATNPTHASRADAYRYLQGVFLTSRLRIATRLGGISEPRRINEAGLLLRKIHDPHHGGELDRYSGIHGVERSYEFFKKNHESGTDELRQGFGAFADLVNDAFNLGNGTVFRNRSEGARTGIHRFREGYGASRIYPDHALFWMLSAGAAFDPIEEQPPLLEMVSPGEEDEKALVNFGLHPDEFSEPVALLFDPVDFLDPPEEPEGLRFLPPLKTLYAAARARYRAEVMRAQSFRTRLERPHVNVMARLLGAIEEIYSKKNAQPDKDSAVILETLHLCAVSIVTGHSFREALKLIAVDSVKDLPGQWALAFSRGYRVWLRPYPIPDRNPLADALSGKHVDVRPRIILSDVWTVGSKLPVPRDKCWFNSTGARYEMVFAKSIQPELVASGIPAKWANSDSLGRILPSWFDGHEEGELLRISAIFGRDTPQSAVQSHYIALDRPCLDEYYCRIMGELWSLMLTNGFNPKGQLFEHSNPSSIPDSMAGNDWAPKIEPVKALLVALRDRIQAHQASTPYEYHNLVTCYVGIALGIVSAFRDVRTPILDLTLIDPETGFLPIQEKDRSDGTHARLVWIPPRVREAVDHYLMHLRSLWTILPFNMPTEIIVPATKFRDRQAFGSNEFSLSLQKTLFLFTGNNGQWAAVEFSGRRLQAYLNEIMPEHWNIPNTGRHLAATTLFNMDNSFSTIDKTLLGHWHLGESPWAPDSGFDPIHYRDQLAPKMEALLNQLDFQPIKF